MNYIDIKNHFLEEAPEFLSFLDDSFSHLEDLEKSIDLNDDFFILCNHFTRNTDLKFYISLNNFFNNTQPSTYDISDKRVVIKTLLSMAAASSLLMRDTGNIPITFFIIHSAIDYGVSIEVSYVEHNNYQNMFIYLLMGWKRGMIPDDVAAIVSNFLTYAVVYAKKHSTDYHLVNDLIYNIKQMPSLLESMINELYLPLLCQLLDWCYDNRHEDLRILYDHINTLSSVTEAENTLLYIELCLYRFREQFDTSYDYRSLATFYETNYDKLDLINRLRVLSQLIIKLDRNKYLNEFSKEILQLNVKSLIPTIEDLYPKVFSIYFINLAFYKNQEFLKFLHENYGCTLEVLESTVIYIHSDDSTYILEKEQHKLDIIDPDLHFNIIQYINKINNLGITVFGESIEQIIPNTYMPHRENVPLEQYRDIERKLIDGMMKYYFIDNPIFNDTIKYILPMQQIRVPLQQLLLKKYNKLFPLVKIMNKEAIPEKTIEKVIHIVLSESGTLDQEKEAIEHLSTISDNIEFEYKYIDDFEELLNLLKSDIYSLISITSHGEVDARDPLNNCIKVGSEYIPWSRFEPETYNINNQRLLYLNICDSGHFSLKNGFLLESFSTYLTNSYQATVSHMWPVNQTYSSTFLMIFLHHLISKNSFKDAYAATLSLAIDNNFGSYIDDQNLTALELFSIFKNNSSLKKESIIHWGSLLYQE